MYREMFLMRVYGPPQALDRVDDLLLHRNPLEQCNPFRNGLTPYSIFRKEDFSGVADGPHVLEVAPLQIIPGLGSGRKYIFDGAVDGVYPIVVGNWNTAEYGPVQCTDADYTLEHLSYDLGVVIVINGWTSHGLSGDYERIDFGRTRGMYHINSGEAVEFDERDDAFSGVENLEGMKLERRMGTSSTRHLVIGSASAESDSILVDVGDGDPDFGTEFDIWSCYQNSLPETVTHHVMRFRDWKFIRGLSYETSLKKADEYVMKKIYETRNLITVIGESGLIFSKAGQGMEFAVYQNEEKPSMLFIAMKRNSDPLPARTNGWDVSFIVYDTDKSVSSDPMKISADRPLPIIGTAEEIGNIVTIWRNKAASALVPCCN